MPADTLTLILAFVAVAGPIVTAVVARRTSTNAQHVNVDVNALIDRIALLESELAQVKSDLATVKAAEAQWEADVDERDKRIDELEQRVVALESWIRSQGADPEVIVGGAQDGYVFPFEDVEE